MILFSILGLSFGQEAGLYTTGNFRLNATSRPGFVVDFEGRELDSGLSFDSRLRAYAGFKKSGWTFELGGDALHGQFAGSPWNLEGTQHRYHPERNGVVNVDNFLLRSAQVKKQMGLVGLQAGVTTSHWGLGLVSNDGNHSQLFGRQDYGDRVARVSANIRPVDQLVVMAGGDWVLEDDIGGYTDGYQSLQGLGSVQWLFSKTDRIGFLGVYRKQTDMETERVLQGAFYDIYGTLTKEIGAFEIYAGAEAAVLRGHTNQILNRNNPAGLDVRSGGGVAEFQLRHDRGMIGMNGGYSSGDADSSDELYTAFSFDRDYNAGSLLFDVHQAAREIAQYNLITDPEHAGNPPDGIEFAVTEGAIRQTVFAQPMIAYPVTDWMNLAVGTVLAWNTVPVRSSFISYRNGGGNYNHLGTPTEGYSLGTEVDWAVVIHHQYQSGLLNLFTIEGAHLLPSANLGNEETLSLFRVQSSVAW